MIRLLPLLLYPLAAQAAVPHVGPTPPTSGAADIKALEVGFTGGFSPVAAATVVASGPIGLISPFAWETGLQLGTGELVAAVEPAFWVRSGNFVRKGLHFGLRLGGRGGYAALSEADAATVPLTLGLSALGQVSRMWHEMGGISFTGGYEAPAHIGDQGLDWQGRWECNLRWDMQISRTTGFFLGVGWPLYRSGAGLAFQW